MTVAPPGNRAQFLALCAVNLIVAADFLGTSVLLDPIGRELGLTTATLAWVVNGYLLTLAAPLIAFGRLADRLGAARLMRLALVVFAAGSVITGAADAAGLLVLGRMVQGLGASALTATGLALVSASAAPAGRGRSVGIWAGVGAVGSAGGPLLAGAIAVLVSWRWFFFVDAPFAIAVLLVLRTAVAADRRERTRGVDGLDVGLVTAGLGALVFALLAGPDAGWGSPQVVLGALAAMAALGGVVHRERTVAHPLLDPALFGARRYRRVALVAFVANAAFAVVAFFASLYLQQVAGLSTAGAGAVFLAMTVPLIVLSPRAAAVARRCGVGRVLAAGMTVIAASALLFAVLDADGGLLTLTVALVLSGAGQAFVFTLSNVAAVDARPGAAGLESGVINAVRQVGALVGLAALGALFAGLQQRADGPATAAFVSALRAPSVVLASVCLATAVIARGIRSLASEPG